MSVKEKTRTRKNVAKWKSKTQRERFTERTSLLPLQPSQTDAAAISGRSQNVLIGILVGIATLGVYFPVLRHPFINYDDNVYITANRHVTTGLSWQNFKWACTAMAAGNWHPLTWFSHALDWQIFGGYAGGHHLISLLVHMTNAILLFWLLRRATGARWKSATVATLFALHPLNVESVAWAAERKNLLCTFFFLLALAAYGWYARKPQVKRYLFVAALFALGLASKPMAVTLPFALLLVDFWPLGRIRGWSKPSAVFPLKQEPFLNLAIEKLPLLAMSVASGVVTLFAQRSSGAVSSVARWSVALRLENAVHAYAEYLWKTFYPQALAVFYPATPIPAWQVSVAAVFLLALAYVVYKCRARCPYAVMGFLWFIAILIPVIGLVQVGAQSMADRYTYLPCIGVFIAIVWAASDAASSLKVDRRWIAAAAIIALAALSLITAHQLRFWSSSYELWAHTLQVTNSNFVAEENLGNSLAALSKDDEALLHFFNAERLEPDNATAQLGLATTLLRRARYSEAIEHFNRVVLLSKDDSFLASAYKGLGFASAQIGDRASARKYFLLALNTDPNDRANFYNLGLLETQDGIDKLTKSASEHPTAEAYLQLGQLLQNDRRISDAQDAYRKALNLNPKLAQAKQALLNLANP